MLRKILSPITTEPVMYGLQITKEVVECTDIQFDMRKRRLKLYGHIKHMESSRLTRQISEFYVTRRMAKQKQLNGMSVKEDLRAAGITQRVYDWKLYVFRIQSNQNFKLKVSN